MGNAANRRSDARGGQDVLQRELPEQRDHAGRRRQRDEGGIEHI
jgi:hypothetical protein